MPKIKLELTEDQVNAIINHLDNNNPFTKRIINELLKARREQVILADYPQTMP